MIVRSAIPADLESIVLLRMRLFAETDETLNGESAAQVEQATRGFFLQNLASSLSRSWVALVGETVVSIGTLAFFSRPPYPGNLAGSEAYLLNMYTLPEYRKQGLAKAILEHAMSFAHESGCAKVWLHTSPAGRALYEAHGFCAHSSYLEWMPR